MLGLERFIFTAETHNVIEETSFEAAPAVLGVGLERCMSCRPRLYMKRLTYKVPGSPGGFGLVSKTGRGIVIALLDPSAPAHTTH